MPPHNRHTFRTWALCALAILVCLVAPGVALGSNGDDAAPAAANDPQTATTGSSSGSDASTTDTTTSTTQSTPAVESPAVTPDASPQSAGNGNGNGNGNANGAGNDTPTANAAPPTPTPDPAPALPSNGNGNGNDPNKTNGQENGSQNQANGLANAIAPNLSNGTNNGNSDHAADANANANSSQDKPKNVNVDVRVGQPGDNGAVAQGNNSTAAAAAGASGGSSGAGAAQQTAAGSTDSSGSDAGPNGAAALAPSQADSTGGETIPVANSPPCSESASNPAATGSAGTATTASTGASTPTVLNTSPSASCVNGASSDPQTAAGGGANGSSNPQATNVTGGSAPSTAPNSGQAPGVTPDYSASNGQIVIMLPGPSDDAVDASTPGDGTSSTTIGPDDGTDGTTPNPVPDVVITAPAPTGSSSVDSANANATSTQVQPTNINASVRILSPGDNGQVSQSNDSSAVAAAGAQGTDATALPEATSTQVDPHNVNVSIRVGSPGDDSAITQTNTSTAAATPVDPASIEAATVDLPNDGPNSAADVQNVSGIIQDLVQCPEESTCLPSSAPDPAGSSALAAADQSTANATQQAPSNVSVSIRVASPGMDGIVNQLNGANADGATTVTTTTDPENVVVGVVVPGDPADVRIPNDPSVPWNWIWSWTTGTAPLSPDATPISSPDWNWIWTNPADATTTATPATDTAVPPATPGQWTWTWVWTRGDGWTTSWTYSQPCSCTWNWIWTWNWPAGTQTSAPNTAPAQIPAPPSDPQVVQTNNSSAAAAALTTFDGQQTSVAATDGDPGLATDYQGITSDQNALATADAVQVRPLNLSVVTGGWVEKITQANDTVAAASAAAFDTAIQSVTQDQTGTADGALHAVDAAQVIFTAQNATANAQSAQADAANVVQVWSQISGNQAEIGEIFQRNQAVTAAYAAVASETTQIIDQSQIGGGAEQLATALQAAIITQAHQAAVGVAQAHVKNRATIEIPWNGLWNPPIDQSNDVSAVAVSTAYSGIAQTIVQEESGDGIAWDEHAVQTAIVIQSGSASGGASQSFRENVAGWNGTVASSAPAGGNELASELASVNAALSGPNGLIVGTPPLPAGGVLAGHVVYVSHGSGRAVLVRSPWAALPAGTRNATAAGTPGTPADRGGAASGSTPYRHLLLNLLGAMSSTLGVFFGTTPFAALLALFMIAALGVGRLQYPVPALGRPADFARRERPG